MDQTPTPPPAPLSAAAAAAATTTYADSIDSSPRSRNTDSWGEDNNASTAAQPTAPAPAPTKLRLMCSYGGHIVPRPHDKSLCYIGGDTRIVVVDRHTTLSDLTQRLSKTLLLRSTTNTTNTTSFTLKYQLPSEDLDSLISVTTDEDLENMIDEYERLNTSSDVSKSSRLRLFLFPTKPESVSSIGSLLENSTKSEDWFLNALNGTTSGFSDTSSVNCLLGLDDDVLVVEKKDDQKGGIGKNLKGNSSAQDVHSVPDLERTSSFGSASSSPSLASLPPIRVHVDDNHKGGGIEEQFSQMSVQQQKHQDDGGFVGVPAPASVVVTGVPVSSAAAMAEYPNRSFTEDERSEQGSQMVYQKLQQQQQQQYQQKQSMGFDLASPDSVSSDGRQKPPMIYQDPVVQIQSSNNNNRAADPNNIPDQNARIQMQQQQQQIPDSAYMMSMSTPQVDPQHPQLHHQQQPPPQFIHTAVPPPQYLHHGAVPMPSYYQMYPSQTQHHPHHPPLDQQNFVYYMPARQAPIGYNMPMQQQPTSYPDPPPAAATYAASRTAQTAGKSELPSQFVQPQPQPQYVGYSVASSATSAGANANYGYEFTDPVQQGQHMYYAAQPMPPQSAAQYQTMTGEAGLHLAADNNNMKQQQVRTSQP